MIALPATSQIKYTIDNKCYTCYTPDENRAIAILILKGERDSILLVNSYKIIDNLNLEVKALNTKDDVSREMVKLLHRDYQKLYAINENLVIKNRRLKCFAITGFSTAGVLLLMLVL